MKLLLLLPNLVLLSVSGYNLYTGLTTSQGPNYIVYNLLHIAVSIICLTFIGMIIRSLFSIKYIETEQTFVEEAYYNETNLQHQTVNI
ncbi:hypothetical protein [Flavobacterium rhizosphaerae]|uniref:Uncharacterized protein n=1 Tax=Flavobacterium rhizosphaerae TaxID=3163298 RepID=A0ABW8YXJ6_9FLAO